jgi:hypothetical protein
MIRFGKTKAQRQDSSMSRKEAIEVLKRMHSNMAMTMNLNAKIGARHDLEDTVITARLEGYEDGEAVRLAIEHLSRLEVPVQFGLHLAVPPVTAAQFVLGVIALGLGVWFAIHGLGFGWQREAFTSLDPDSNKLLGAVMVFAGVWLLAKVRFW